MIEFLLTLILLPFAIIGLIFAGILLAAFFRGVMGREADDD